MLKNSLPIGNQVVENTYIELFKMFLRMNVSIYDVVKIHTDEIYITSDKSKDITDYILNNVQPEIGGYKLPVSKIPQINRDILGLKKQRSGKTILWS